MQQEGGISPHSQGTWGALKGLGLPHLIQASPIWQTQSALCFWGH